MRSSPSTDHRVDNPEQDYVAKELVELRAALGARDESKVLVGCASVTSSLPRMPKAMGSEIEQLCYTDAPRLYLENAVSEATESKAEHPGLDEINCAQLLAEDAFETIKLHPSKDPALRKLVDEYTRQCPEAVAKFRARP